MARRRAGGAAPGPRSPDSARSPRCRRGRVPGGHQAPWASTQPADQCAFLQRFAAAHLGTPPSESPRIRRLPPGPRGGCPAAGNQHLCPG
eukprot:3734498-Alexandrium_andersonii.AAC.1